LANQRCGNAANSRLDKDLRDNKYLICLHVEPVESRGWSLAAVAQKRDIEKCKLAVRGHTVAATSHCGREKT
jgi:hypothetical protein